MAEVILKNVRKVYPNTESKKKKKKDEAVEKKNNLEITDEGVVAARERDGNLAPQCDQGPPACWRQHQR